MTGRQGPRRNAAAVWIAGSFATAVLLAVAGVALSGAAQERVLGDPGAVARWGLPAVLAVHHLALAAVVGALVFAATIVPRRIHSNKHHQPGTTRRSGDADHPAFLRAITVASVAAVVWVPAAAVVLLLTYADIAGSPLSAAPSFTAQLGVFVTDIATGRARLVILIIAVLISMLVLVVRSSLGLLVLAGLCLASIIPATSAIGHAAGSTDHIGASNTLGLHIGAGTVWAGGIIVLAAIIPALAFPDPGSISGKSSPADTATIMARFSVLAGLAFALVVATGAISSLYRIESIGNLLSPYGLLLVSKTAATLLLGLLGLFHRRRIIPQLAGATGQPRLLWQILIVELFLMGGAAGLAVALARSPSPVPLEPDPTSTPAQLLTGYLLPPAPDGFAWLSQWRPDWLWITAAVFAALAYAWAYLASRRKGAGWPRKPLLSWISALILLTFITSGPPAVYAPVLLTAHTASMVTLVFAVPVLLLAGTPLRLILSVLPARTDGSSGAQKIVLSIARAATKPGPVLYGLALGSVIILFYLTPAFALSLSEHVAHETVLILFLTLGLLFINAVYIRESPGFRGPQVVSVSVALSGIAAVGLGFLRPAGIEQDWFTGLGRVWGPSTAADQQQAGIILLSACALTAVAFVVSRSVKPGSGRRNTLPTTSRRH
ncbi:cytochrome c oxidase assembly protein [Arthrobacter sp. TMN-50]